MVLGIFCAGGFGGVVYELARELNQKNTRWEKIYFIDDVTNEAVVRGTSVFRYKDFCNKFSNKESEITIASGEPYGRNNIYKIIKAEGYQLASLIHPDSYVSSNIEIGEGIIVLWGASLTPSNLTVGKNVVVMSHAHLSHDCLIGDHSVIASSAVISGNCKLGKCTYIGINASIREEIIIGEYSIVGMGAVVVKNVPDNTVVVGNPAKVINNNKRSVFN
ncbi:MAG: acetyltransferase [Spirochaetes bacterium]|nr:acetyltransferase [Spirochaetota bacterium]